jgi:hypothetical protein
LARVPAIARGQFDLADIRQLHGESWLSGGPAEGVYGRREDDGRLLGRAKMVRPEFVQEIDSHRSGRPLQTNISISGATW